MAHVELSLSESLTHGPSADPAGSFDRWVTTVAISNEPCLVIDRDRLIVAASPACCELLGLSAPGETPVGRHLLDGVLRLVDFTAARSALTSNEMEKIPPVLALSSKRLARGLMRVHDGASLDATVDAIATPLSDGRDVVGSLTFLSPV